MTTTTTLPTPGPELNEVIAPSAIVSVDFSTGFFGRIHRMVGFLTDDKTPAQLAEAHEQITNRQVKPGTWVDHYHTLLLLCSTYEHNARETGQMQWVSDEEVQRLQRQYGVN